jgi:maltooligosyltrehalose synthase
MCRPTLRADVPRPAASIADYLAALGISHLYGSPYLQAATGSTHGYDIVDPRAVNRELGGAPGHARRSEAYENSYPRGET